MIRPLFGIGLLNIALILSGCPDDDPLPDRELGLLDGGGGTDTGGGFDAGGMDTGGGFDSGGGEFDTGTPDTNNPPPPPPVDAGMDTNNPPPPPPVDAGPDVPMDMGTPPDPPPAGDCWSEPINPTADISDLVASYGPSNYRDTIIQIFQRRHPATAYMLSQLLMYESRPDGWSDGFTRFVNPSSWAGNVNNPDPVSVKTLDWFTHEGTHFINAYIGNASPGSDPMGQQAVYLTESTTPLLGYSIGGFPRSEVRSMMAYGGDGSYATTYLTGEQGSRGIVAVLDETSCYINEIAGFGSGADIYSGTGFSLRDGAVAFLYILELYLKRGRENYPTQYNSWKANPDIVELVGNLWVRAHFMLEQVGDTVPSLGISDGMYRTLIHQPANEQEIEMFIGKQVGNSACFRD